MYTVKIRWRITTGEDLVEEHVLFRPAKMVDVFGKIDQNASEMAAWPETSYLDYRNIQRESGGDQRMVGRLISVTDEDGQQTWYLATTAWLLGPNGSTIERIAP